MGFEGDILQRFIGDCVACDLIRPNGTDRVLAAVSGGSDSIAMLDLLHRWRELGAGFQLAVGHFNHRLRPEADAEQKLVEERCRVLGIACHSGSGDVRSAATQSGASIHAAARELRYDFLTKTGQTIWPDNQGLLTLIATAHQRDDQAETILMRILSGSGLESLAGIRRRERWKNSPAEIIRPLLDVSRQDLVQYCSERRIAYATDSSNQNLQYPRASVRHRLLPILRGSFGEICLESLANLCAEASPPADRLAGAISAAAREALLDRDGAHWLLDYTKFVTYLDILRTGLILRACRTLSAPGARFSRERLEAADSKIRGGENGACQMGHGITVALEGKQIAVRLNVPWDGSLKIRLNHDLSIPGYGRLEFRLRPAGECPLPPPPNLQYCDWDRLSSGSLIVRPARPGDRMIPLGSNRPAKVTELLRNAGVHRARRSYPVVECDGEIVVMPPYRIAERVKLTPATYWVAVFQYSIEQ